jgi:hypothetical protein
VVRLPAGAHFFGRTSHTAWAANGLR